MKANELTEHDWFTRPPDISRIFKRLSGKTVIVDGKECVPVKPLQPTAMMPGFYMTADTEVEPYGGRCLRLM